MHVVVAHFTQLHNLHSLDIPYHNNTKLDIYHPDKKQDGSLSRIIVFVYGGGWGSGSKTIYSTLANTLRELGYVVVVPDYRKYPEVKIDSIYQDIRESIKWTHKHATEFHGDPEQIYLMVCILLFAPHLKTQLTLQSPSRATALVHTWCRKLFWQTSSAK